MPAQVAPELLDDWMLEATRNVARAALVGPTQARAAIVEEMARAVPEADGVVLLERDGAAQPRCVHVRGKRFELFGDVPIGHALDLTSSRAIDGEHRLHPGDVDGYLVSLGSKEELAPAGVTAGVYLATMRGRLAPDGLEELREWVRVVSPIYTLCRARDHDQTAAYYDGLTGVLRPNSMRQRMKELAAAGRSMAFCFIDGDHFKRWNDTYGHQSGDLAIRHIARTVDAHKMGEMDLVGRMGGDEFAIAFIDALKADAVRQAIRICIALARADLTPYTLRDERPDFQITASIGVALLGEDAEDVSEMLKLADEATYRSKDRGRDCVTYYERGEFADVTLDERRQEEQRVRA